MNKRYLFPIMLAIFALVALIAFFPPPAGPASAPDPTPTPTITETPAPTPPPVTAPPPTNPLPSPEAGVLESPYVFVYNSGTEAMYYTSGGEDTRIAPASITKLLTALVALEVLKEDEVITVGSEVSLIDPSSSVAYIARGQKLRVDMLIEGLLLQSGNDTAYTLAAAAGRKLANNPNLSAKGALRRFVEHMNFRALEMGLTNTHFENPDGIDGEDHYTCLADLATVSVLAMENATIRRYVGKAKDSVTYESGQTITWSNTNELLHASSKYYCAEAVGLKTGTTTKAGNCLVSAFPKDGGYLFIGVLGGASYYGRYKDTLALYNLYKDYKPYN